MMAGHAVPLFQLLPDGRLDLADLRGVGATGVETATQRVADNSRLKQDTRRWWAVLWSPTGLSSRPGMYNQQSGSSWSMSIGRMRQTSDGLIAVSQASRTMSDTTVVSLAITASSSSSVTGRRLGRSFAVVLPARRGRTSFRSCAWASVVICLPTPHRHILWIWLIIRLMLLRPSGSNLSPSLSPRVGRKKR